MKSRLQKWSKELVVLAVIFVLAFLLMDWWRKPALPNLIQLSTLSTIDNKAVSLMALSQEQPVLVYFWSSWCGICKTTTPTVNRLAQEVYNVASVVIRPGDNAKFARGIESKGLVFRL